MFAMPIYVQKQIVRIVSPHGIVNLENECMEDDASITSFVCKKGEKGEETFPCLLCTTNKGKEEFYLGLLKNKLEWESKEQIDAALKKDRSGRVEVSVYWEKFQFKDGKK